MKQDIVVPKLRTDESKAVLAAWLKDVGETVEAGEALYEIETDKVVNQIEATKAGVLEAVFVEEGDDVAPGQRVAVIESSEK